MIALCIHPGEPGAHGRVTLCHAPAIVCRDGAWLCDVHALPWHELAVDVAFAAYGRDPLDDAAYQALVLAISERRTTRELLRTAVVHGGPTARADVMP